MEDIKIKDTTMETSNYTVPQADCYNENGQIDKYKYMLQFPNFNKHDKKQTKKILETFIKHNETPYFRMIVKDTLYGVNFILQDKTALEPFYNEVWSCIESTVDVVKAFDFNTADNYDSIEIWGITTDNEPRILFLYNDEQGTIEIGDAK